MAGPRTIIGGKYELQEVAGEGGMAVVWRATTHGVAGFSRQVAIKRIRPELRAIKNYVDMFIEEARVGAELQHPNIVQVFDFCIDDEGAYCLVMEWVEGLDLGRFIRTHRQAGAKVPWQLAAAIGIEVLRGLAAAHERKGADGAPAPVIHRDVSPHNILLATAGVAKLTDFGLARARDRIISLTAPGTVKGKVAYLSPELTRGAPASPASDIFAMGAVMWELLAGERLFDGPADLDVFRLIREHHLRPLAPLRPDAPARLVTAIDRALGKTPGDRFATAREMADELAAALRHDTTLGDPQAQLGERVLAARRRLGIRPPAVAGEAHLAQRLASGASVDITFSDAALTSLDIDVDD